MFIRQCQSTLKVFKVNDLNKLKELGNLTAYLRYAVLKEDKNRTTVYQTLKTLLKIDY